VSGVSMPTSLRTRTVKRDDTLDDALRDALSCDDEFQPKRPSEKPVQRGT
jgi:hypothetical protein